MILWLMNIDFAGGSGVVPPPPSTLKRLPLMRVDLDGGVLAIREDVSISYH